MTNKHSRLSYRAALLPLLFCSATVLAGDGGIDAPYGQLPPPSQNELTLETEQAADVSCDSGDPSRGECADVESAAAAAPDSMQQAKQLSNESDGFIEDATETGAPSLNTGYIGGKTRIGIGIDSEFKGKADLSHVFTETEDTAVIGQGYIGVNPKKDDAKGHITGAGAKLNYHWVSKDEAGQASHVNKVFGAYDQNGSSDKDGKQAKKVTVGYGQERENMFWSGSVMKGLGDKFDTGQKDKNGNTIYEKGYDWGVGGRVGTFISEQQMRVQGGLDYEWGTEHAATESKAKQVTLTGGVEKFFPDSPHSVNANIDVYKKSGGYVEGDQKAEVRGGVGYRYDLASESGIWQADKMYRRVRTEIPGEEVKKPAKVERKLVKHTMELEADSFFKVDSAKLTPEALERMNSVAAKMRECGSEGNIRISGNTCDIGSTAHNQKLSERRANSVREFLIKNGFPAETLLAQGLGESSPKYPNTESERHKNRRVDVEYVCYQNEYKDQVVEEGGATRTDPKVVWKQELIPTPPLWVRQGLHNVADHKQRVDTYKTTAGGEKEPEVCEAPIAENDTKFTVKSGEKGIIDYLLDNDTICEKDKAKIVKVECDGQGSTGLTINGQTVEIEVTSDKEATKECTYTLEDAQGRQASAKFSITVTTGEQPSGNPIAKDDTFPTAITTGNVLQDNGNGADEDPNGDETKLKVTVDNPTSSLGGTIAMQLDGSFTFDHKNKVGDHKFMYTIEDEEGLKDDAFVTITVTDADIGGSCPTNTSFTEPTKSYDFIPSNPTKIEFDLTDYVDAETISKGIDVMIRDKKGNEGTVINIIYSDDTNTPSGKVEYNETDKTVTFTHSQSYCSDPTSFDIIITPTGCSSIMVHASVVKNP
ncbi:OmpA family protein [Thiothrix unzii]|jgi:outer membrane protein OmpA-like peptidoglycan-associated protein|uniref:OmpA family protein n=1 Tax=Thiothrix unzii TaxID=111769 RepID=UPI002A36F3DD|nr:OmpA family protein [Thiothrix unzii]MDX9989261.1 OmpA family protein [Thiothrix unzii]